MPKQIFKTKYIFSFMFIIIFLLIYNNSWYLNIDRIFALFELKTVYKLSDDESAISIDIVKNTIKNPQQAITPTDAPATLSDKFIRRDFRDVWVDIYVPNFGKLSGHSYDATLYRGITKATYNAISSNKQSSVWLNTQNDIYIHLEIMESISDKIYKIAPYLFFAIEPGIDGIIMEINGKKYFQRPSEVITKGLLTPRVSHRVSSVEALFNKLSKDSHFKEDIWKSSNTNLYKFRTTNISSPLLKKEINKLYRMNKIMSISDIKSKDIYSSIEIGGKWLLNQIKSDGRFNYEYYPNQNIYPATYNVVRHAGTIYGLLHLYKFLQKKEYLDAVYLSMPFLYQHIKKMDRNSNVLAVEENNTHPTGAVALALLSFIYMPKSFHTTEYNYYTEGLGNFLIKMIDSNGSVFESFELSTKSKNVIKEPLYYPGETMLALVLLFEETKNSKWLDAAERIAKRQIRLSFFNKSSDHWVIQALYYLYMHTKNKDYMNACFDMGDEYITTQYPPNEPPFLDYFGAWKRTTEIPRTTRAGSRSEALGAVMRLAWETRTNATKYETALIFAAKHQIEQQFSKANSFFFINPSNTIGGFRAGLVDNHLRIDFNQHSTVGLIAAFEAKTKIENKMKN